MSDIDHLQSASASAKLKTATSVPLINIEEPAPEETPAMTTQEYGFGLLSPAEKELHNFNMTQNQDGRNQLLQHKYDTDLGSRNTEIEDFGGVVDMLHLFSGIQSSIVTKQWEGIAASLYKNDAINFDSLRQKNSALRANSRLSADLDELYMQRMEGNRTKDLANQIAALSKRVVNPEDYAQHLPTGFFNTLVEDVSKTFSTQTTNLYETSKGAMQGATGAGAAAIAMSLVAGAVVGGLPLAGAAAVGATSIALMKGGAMAGQFMRQQRMMAGAAYREMFDRMMAEGLSINETELGMVANLNGSAQAAISVVETLVGVKSANIFGLKKGVLNAISSPKYINMLGNSLKKRLLNSGGVLSKEIGMELLEEGIGGLINEVYMNDQGSETAFSMTKEDMIESALLIAKDTFYMTMGLKMGGDMIGLVSDSSMFYSQQRALDANTTVNKRRTAALNTLPSNFDPSKVNIINGEAVVDQEILDTDGQTLYEASVNDPGLVPYLSPAQKVIIGKYKAAYPDAVIESIALETITGKSISELDGKTVREQVILTKDQQSEIRFEKRMNLINPDVEMDGDPVTTKTTGGDVEVQLQRESVGYVITMKRGDEVATLRGSTTLTGAFSPGEMKSTFKDKTEMLAIFEDVFPSDILFDNKKTMASKLNKRALILQKKYDDIVKKGATAKEINTLKRSIVKLQKDITATGGTQTAQPGKGKEKKFKHKVVEPEIVQKTVDIEVEDEVETTQTVEGKPTVKTVKAEGEVWTPVKHVSELIKVMEKELQHLPPEEQVTLQQSIDSQIEMLAVLMSQEAEADAIMEAADIAANLEKTQHTEADIPDLEKASAVLKDLKEDTATQEDNATIAGRDPSLSQDDVQADIDAIDDEISTIKGEPVAEREPIKEPELDSRILRELELIVEDLKKEAIEAVRLLDEGATEDAEGNPVVRNDLLRILATHNDALKSMEDAVEETKEYINTEKPTSIAKDMKDNYVRAKDMHDRKAEYGKRTDTPIDYDEIERVMNVIIEDLDESIQNFDERTRYELMSNTGSGFNSNPLRKVKEKIEADRSEILGTPEKVVIISDESTKKLSKLQLGRRNLSTIYNDIQNVFTEHRKEKTHPDKVGNARLVAIVSEYMGELKPKTREYFQGMLTDENFGDFGITRSQYADQAARGRTGTTDFRVPVYNPADLKKTLQELKEPVPVADLTKAPALEAKTKAFKNAHKPEKKKVTTKQAVRKKKVVKKKVSTAKIQEEVGEFTAIDDPERVANTYIAGEITREISDNIDSIQAHAEDLISLITTMAVNITSPFYRNTVDRIFTKNQITLSQTFLPREDNESVKGFNFTPQDFDEAMSAMLRTMEGASIKKIETLYSDLLQAAKADSAMMSVDVGAGRLPFMEVQSQIVEEIKGARGFGKFAKGLRSIYNETTGYHLLIEKIVGKQSLLYKVMYGDVKSASRDFDKFRTPMLKNYNDRMTDLPDGTKAHKYYKEIVTVFEGIEIDKELSLALIGHSMDLYNRKAIQNNGMEFIVGEKLHILNKEQASELLTQIGSMPMTQNDSYILSVFSELMDELHAAGNPKHVEYFNKEMTKYEGFHMALRTSSSSDTVKLGTNLTNADEVRAVYASPQMYVRHENQRRVAVSPISSVVDSTINSMGRFIYTDEAYSRAQVLINSPQIKSEIENKYDKDYVKFIEYGLEKWAGKYVDDVTVVKYMDKIRRNYAGSILFGSIELAIQQAFSLPAFSVYVDAKYLMKSSMDLAMDKKRIEDFLTAWSTDYENRGEYSGSLAMKAHVEKIKERGYRSNSKSINELLRAPMKGIDKNTVRIGMYAAVLQFQAEVEANSFSPQVKDALDIDDSSIAGMTPEVVNQQAILFAEYVADRTQPNSKAEFTSHLQTATATGRMLTMFGTFTNTIKDLMAINYEAYKRGDPNAKKALVLSVLNAMVIIPVMTALFKTARVALNDALADIPEDERDPIWETFLLSYLGLTGGLVFGVREFSRVVTGEEQSVELSVPFFDIFNTLLRGGNNIVKAANNEYSDEERATFLMKGMNEGLKGIMMYNGKSVWLNNKASVLLKRRD